MSAAARGPGKAVLISGYLTAIPPVLGLSRTAQ
jgi:hypothetical protein